MQYETHTASRIILATPRAIFRAFLDPEVIPRWRAPAGMTAKILQFEPRPGGLFRMAFACDDRSTEGKSGSGADIFRGRFVELLPDEQIVEEIEFETDKPQFAGPMTMTTQLIPVKDGTKVTFSATNVPIGISEQDHRAGMESSLKKLALLLE